MDQKSKGVLLYGGGLDSTALLLELCRDHDLIALHINYGQVAYERERHACSYWCWRYDVSYVTLFCDLQRAVPGASIVGGDNGDVMDGRNLVLISIAAMYAAARQIEDIYVGFHQEPPNAPFPDAMAAALEETQFALDAMFRARIIVSAPFSHLSRFQIVKRAVAIDAKFLEKTHTCYTNEFGGCGKCAHCIQKAGFESQLRAGV